MFNSGSYIFRIIFINIIFSGAVYASNPSPSILRLSDFNAEKVINRKVLFFNNQSQIDLQQIKAKNNSDFEAFDNKNRARFGWIKFAIKNDLDKSVTKAIYFSDNSFDYVESFVTVERDGLFFEYQPQKSGQLIPRDERNFKTSLPMFDFLLEPEDTLTFYFKYEISNNKVFNIILGDLGDALYASYKETLVIYVYAGIVFSLVLYQLFLFFTFRKVASPDLCNVWAMQYHGHVGWRRSNFDSISGDFRDFRYL